MLRIHNAAAFMEGPVTGARSGNLLVVVSTIETAESILAQGGIGNWVLSPNKASRCKYVVCCRKEDWRNRIEGIPARNAFLVGAISELKSAPGSENSRGQSRFFIGISSYARVNLKGVWTVGRNPVTYRTPAELGIDVKTLRFKPLAGKSDELPRKRSITVSQAIANAKKSLADSLDVGVDDIEITIRG
jgi:hypothetical protein